jgi:membrane-associated phospholipid phosphatase
MLCRRVAVGCLVACLLGPVEGLAQVATITSDAITLPTTPLFPQANIEPSAPGFWVPFQAIPNDFARFFSADTMKIAGFGGLGALAVHQWDGKGIVEAQAHLRPSMFRAGNVGGGFFVQAGASIGLYTIARVTGSRELSSVGADLIRAQVLTQGIVQAGKFATRRQRPDASNAHSFPSGHTASAFATATVLKDHYGWKVGVPAYTFGAYVAASRMSANKHHLSDVVMGAAIGVAAGRTVTLGSGRARFAMGVAPTLGGAAITFTKR